MSISAALLSIWGGIASPTGQAIIGLANLGGTTYTAVKASQNSNKLSSLQSTCYGIATELKDVKSNTSDLFTISDLEAMVGATGGTTPTTTAPTAAATTTTTAAPAAVPVAPLPTAAPTQAPASPAQDNNVPAWAQQLIQQQMQQAAVIKNLMQQNGVNVPATTVNVNPTPTVPAVPTAPPATATATDSVPTPDAPAQVPAPAPVDPALMAFLQQQADAMNKLASAVTALETSIGEIEAVIDDDSIPTTAPVVTVTPPTPPTGGRGWNDEDEDIEDLIEKSDSHYPASSKKKNKNKKKKHKRKR